LATLAARSTLAVPTCPRAEADRERNDAPSRVASNIEQAKAEQHGHCRRQAEFSVLQDGVAVHVGLCADTRPVCRQTGLPAAVRRITMVLTGQVRSVVILDAAAQTLLLYSLIFYALPAVVLGLLGWQLSVTAPHRHPEIASPPVVTMWARQHHKSVRIAHHRVLYPLRPLGR
jgi:hypothetical protein